VSRRTDAWVKVKCQLRQEFVVGGFTTGSGSDREFGSLLLGLYDEQHQLKSVGSVGTGWDSATAARILQRLDGLETTSSPFAPEHVPKKGRWSKRPAGSERWVRPVAVAEVSFAEWTPDDSIRHPIFRGMREDKPADMIKRKTVIEIASTKGAVGRALKISNADRVIDESTGLTKGDLVAYYALVAE
jgi:bifunctional non-homologous end joining protein LigD